MKLISCGLLSCFIHHLRENYFFEGRWLFEAQKIRSLNSRETFFYGLLFTSFLFTLKCLRGQHFFYVVLLRRNEKVNKDWWHPSYNMSTRLPPFSVFLFQIISQTIIKIKTRFGIRWQIIVTSLRSLFTTFANCIR